MLQVGSNLPRSEVGKAGCDVGGLVVDRALAAAGEKTLRQENGDEQASE
jgi:hypothetical protein